MSDLELDAEVVRKLLTHQLLRERPDITVRYRSSPKRKPQPSKRRRRPSFARMLKHARKTGVDLTVARDGSMTFRSGQPLEANGAKNPWDEVL